MYLRYSHYRLLSEYLFCTTHVSPSFTCFVALSAHITHEKGCTLNSPISLLTTMTFTAFPTQASSWNFTKLVTSFGFTTQQEQQPPGKTDSKEEEQSTRSMDSSPGRPATKQKRSFADITMKLTEAAEEMFLFGTQDYHERTSSARPANRVADLLK